MQKILLFQSGKARFAVDPTCVSEIKPLSALGAAPGTQQARQTIQHQGRALSFIHLATLVDPGNPNPLAAEAKALMLKPLNGAPGMAIVADAINGVLKVTPQQMNALPPIFTGAARSYFSGVVRLEQRLALVLNLPALVGPDSGADVVPRRMEAKPDHDQRPGPVVHVSAMRMPPQGATVLHFGRLERLIEETINRIAARHIQQVAARALRPVHEENSRQSPPTLRTRQARQAGAQAKRAAGHVLIFPASTPAVQGKQVYYLFSLRQVVDVLRLAELQPVPFGPEFAEGVAEWRGRVLPVLSLERCLGIKTSDESMPLRTIVVRAVHQGNDNGLHELYAIFNVGAAVRQLELPLACDPMPVPPWITHASALWGAYETEKTILLVVNLEEMLGLAQSPAPRHEPRSCRIGANA